MTLDIPSLDIRKKVEYLKKESRRYQNYSYYSLAFSFILLIFGPKVIDLFKEYSNVIYSISFGGFLIFFIIAIYFSEKSRATLPILKDSIISGLFDAEFFLDKYQNGEMESMSKAINSLRNFESDISNYKLSLTGFENEKLKDSVIMLKKNISIFIRSLNDHDLNNIYMWMNKFGAWRAYLIDNEIKKFYDDMMIYQRKEKKSPAYRTEEWVRLTGWKYLLSTIIIIPLILMLYFLVPSSREFMKYISGLYAFIGLIIYGGRLLDRIKTIPKDQSLK